MTTSEPLGKSLATGSLKTIPLFQGFNDTDYSQITDVSNVVTFETGKLVLEQGAVSRDLWVLLEGTCEVSRRIDPHKPDSKRVVLAMLEPPGHFGDMSFFSPSPHSADVTTVTAVKLLRITHPDYKELIAEGVQVAYKLAYNVTESLVRRLRRMDDWVAELAASSGSHEEAHHPEWQSFREKLFDRWNL
ncbi:MAG: cyclic nucleotide-binding domain-containing protein [Planctomycetia bacterium]|nr:cyclic nucleotide-binding domain-containing protein [Planctomycetia bacterium]